MKCKYCGKPAGFLISQHEKCRQAFLAKEQQKDEAYASVADAFAKCVQSNGDVAKLKTTVTKKLAKFGGDAEDILVEGWQNAVEDAIADHVLSEEEDIILRKMMKEFGWDQEAVGSESYLKLTKGTILRAVLGGKMPGIEITATDGRMPFNLQKSETLIWLFPDTKYYKEITRTHRVGGTQGASVRVMKGVYYHVGGFKSRPVQTTNTEYLDIGLLGVTNKHLYFFGGSKRFRVAFSKIISFEHHADGIGIQRDLVSATPETFVTGDGWFTCNLISNLPNID